MILPSANGFILPYAANGPTADADMQPGRVLVADNNDGTRRKTTNLLRDAGYAVYDVPDGGRALVAIRQRLADVAVVDNELPDMAGLDLLREAGRIGAGLPVILFTSSYNMHRAVKAMKHGACDYLTKPLEAQKLLAAVAEALQAIQPQRGAPSAEECTERQRWLQRRAAHAELSVPLMHKLSNFFTVSSGVLELLLDWLAADHPLYAQAAESLVFTRKTAGYLDHLRQLAHKSPTGTRDIDLNLIVNRLEPVLTAAVRANISLDTAIDPALGFVNADITQMEQVLIHLVLNARNAMPHGGSISIRTANDDLDRPRGTVPPGSYVVLSVRDTGTGMTADTRARMYQPYFSTREPQDGAGLALTTVADIIARAGGYIACDTSIGWGTELIVYLPRLAAAPTLIGMGTITGEAC